MINNSFSKLFFWKENQQTKLWPCDLGCFVWLGYTFVFYNRNSRIKSPGAAILPKSHASWYERSDDAAHRTIRPAATTLLLFLQDRSRVVGRWLAQRECLFVQVEITLSYLIMFRDILKIFLFIPELFLSPEYFYFILGYFYLFRNNFYLQNIFVYLGTFYFVSK